MIIQLALAMSATTPCTFDNATPVHPYEIMVESEPPYGECIEMQGYVWGYTFFADVVGFYRARADNEIYDPNNGWLGLYFSDPSFRQDNMREAVVVGKLNSCERAYQTAVAESEEGSIIMMRGYCHYRGGLTMNSVQIRSGAIARFTRQYGDENRISFGDLSAERELSTLPQEVGFLFNSYLVALRAGDHETIGQIIGPSNGPSDEADRRSSIDHLAGQGDSPFAKVRDAGSDLQSAYFQINDDPDYADIENEQAWIGCFCVDDECSGRWPISSADATATPGPPYVCLTAYYEDHYVNGEHITGWGLFANSERRTLPEPGSD